MSNDEKLERVLRRFEPGRREAMRKILAGTAIYTAPVVASFSMDSLGGSAHAQQVYCANQPGACAIPTLSEGSQVGLIAALAAAGAYLFRRGR
jgi:hypothetical protein